MKSSEEFKSEVYAMAEVKRKQIKLQKRRIAVIVPCIAVVVLTAIFSVGFSDLPNLQKADYDVAPPEETYLDNADANEIKDVAEAQTTADDFEVESAGNQAQLPNSQSDGATVQNVETYSEMVDGTPIKNTDYLCIRMFFTEPEKQEPYVFTQVIDSQTELREYFKENNCGDEKSFNDFYVDSFDGVFYIAIHSYGYDFKTVTQTEDAIQITVGRSENEALDGNACHMMLPLYEKKYDKTKPIEIIKE